MIRVLSAAALALVVFPAAAGDLETVPPGGAYKKLGDLAGPPQFLPGLGTLYVDPKTLPKGPFLAYDRQGRLVSTVYMIPLKDFETHATIAGLDTPGGAVDHIDMSYNAGHPGVEEPHYDIVLWHVAKGEEARLAE